MTPRRLRPATSFVALVAVAALAIGTGPSLAGPAGPSRSASVAGPFRAGSPSFNGTLFGSSFELSRVGYESSRFFLSGTARSFVPVRALTADGEWRVRAGASAPYRTRVAVYRPIDPRRFNGTVIVEWLNVSGGVDAGPDWTLAHNELVREGFAWVGVSAQAVGVAATRKADPADYASLSHPGDSFSYDIFSQAGQAVRRRAAVMLGGLRLRRLIAVGESQSAFRLVSYIDAVEPLAHVYDGFLVHSRFAGAAPLSQSPQPDIAAPTPTMIRADLHVPVFVFETETDVSLSNTADRLHHYPSGPYRLWEVAGSAHYDDYGLAIGPNDVGRGRGAVLNLAAMQHPTADPAPGSLPSCTSPINTGGTHWVLDAAVHWLNRWVANGTPPPRAPTLAVARRSPVVFARDGGGNVRGGARSPQVDVPIAALTGVGNNPAFCSLFGTTVPYTAGQLARRYSSHKQFVSRWDRATTEDVAAGYLLSADAAELKASAAASRIGT